MADYTMELRKVAEIYGTNEVKGWFKDYDLLDFLTEEQVNLIEEKGIWSKDKLANKIFDHYFMREIGFETPYMFKHFAKVKMQEIMEAKLPIIWSTCLEYNPLTNVDYEEKFTRKVEGSSASSSQTAGSESVGEDRVSQATGNASSTSSQEGSNLSVESDTPQGQISKSEILNGKYASKTVATESEATTENTTATSDSQTVNDNIERTSAGTVSQAGSDTKNETYTRTTVGNSGVMTTYQKMIQQYRDIIVAVDKDIIEELDSLFIGLF